MRSLRSHIRFMAATMIVLSGVFSDIGQAVAIDSPSVVADYRFENVLSSSVSGAPALDNDGPGTNSFTTDTVDGQSRTVLQFPGNNGVKLSPTTTVLSGSSYTIVLLFHYNTLPSYAKIIDFNNRGQEHGLYYQSGQLQYWPDSPISEGSVAAGVYAQVVLTRASTDSVKGYVDGVEKFSFEDADGKALPDVNQALHFFHDDLQGNLIEFSAGAVARIRLYNGALSGSEVEALDRLPGQEPTVLRGDIAGTGDGTLSVLDIIVLTRIILGKNTAPTLGTNDFIRADANADNTLDVSDVIETVRAILHLPPVKALAGGPAPSVELGQAIRLSSGQMVVPIVLDATTALAGLQLSVAVSQGLSLSGSPELAEGLNGFTLATHVQAGRLRIVLYSTTLQSLPAGRSPVVYLPISAEDTGALTDRLQVIDAVAASVLAGRLPVVVSASSATPPSAFALGDAFPNPSNPATSITYEIAQPGVITLSVYNLLGQEVVRLVDGTRTPGRYTVQWAGVNNRGQGVASGVYLYRLTEASGFTQTKRLTLLK